MIFISFPLFNKLVVILPDHTNNENRAMGHFPDLDTCDLENISKYTESFLIDQISIRNRMIRLYNKLNVFVFRSSPVSIKAFAGKEDWYFFSGEELKTYTGAELFTNDELISFKKELIKRIKIAQEHNGKLLIAIVPNKANIYPEFMPDHLVRSNNGGYGMQMMYYLKRNNLPVIDLYEPLLKGKTICPLYYKTDNHWNNAGAFVAANAILQEISKYYPSIKNMSKEEYPISKIKENAGDIAKMLTIEDNVSDFNYFPTPKSGFKSKQQNLNKYKCPNGFAFPWEFEKTRYNKDTTLPSILIIRDSFGEKIFPYLSERSSKCIAIFDAWHYGMNLEIIKNEKPNIVLYLILESQLKNLIKFKE